MSGDVERRLERLERQSRRWRRAAAALAVGTAAIALTGQAGRTGKAIVAEQFVLVDSSGRDRAILGVLPHGQAGLFIYDAERKPLVQLFASPGRGDVPIAHAATGLVLTDVIGASVQLGSLAGNPHRSWSLLPLTERPAFRCPRIILRPGLQRLGCPYPTGTGRVAPGWKSTMTADHCWSSSTRMGEPAPG